METHAYDISQYVDAFSTTDDFSVLNEDAALTFELENKSNMKLERVSANHFDEVKTLSNSMNSLMAFENKFPNPTELSYKNEIVKGYSSEHTDNLKDEGIIDFGEISIKEYREKSAMSIRSTPEIDHVYVVNPIKKPHLLQYDIIDYYEKYSPTTAKTLIDTLFLPRNKICKQCANLQESPIHSDHLIREKKPLYAKEVVLCQHDDASYFKYCLANSDKFDNSQAFMLVYNYVKSTTCSILYSNSQPQEIFDLKTSLKPDIFLITNAPKGAANTELYHRCASNFYGRISCSGTAPMIFRVNHVSILSSIKHVGYDTDLQNWTNYRNDVFRLHCLKQDDIIDHRANRSSLLLLEPLLLMPELTTSRYRHDKNRITDIEHMKIVRIVIAYSLSFFILTTITFYIVYFT